MIDSDELDDRFSIEGEVGFAELENDLVFITISNKYADADICLYGAHVTSFRPHRSGEILWVSPDSYYEEGKAIRGGIPVCFPWFGPHANNTALPQHGFARLLYWEVKETASLANSETMVCLQLVSSEETKAFWPYDFVAEMIITVGLQLSIKLKVTNTSKESFSFSEALHSYFLISSIENIGISGLKDTAYHDQLSGQDGFQKSELLQIEGAETRHYFSTESTCVIHDPVFRRRVRIEKTGSKVTTVWNPGEETCLQIADMPDDAFHEFVCLETVNAFEHIVHLAAGESHELSAIIGLGDGLVE